MQKVPQTFHLVHAHFVVGQYLNTLTVHQFTSDLVACQAHLCVCSGPYLYLEPGTAIAW